MGVWISEFLLYLLKILLFTLGTIVICGFSVHLCARLFARLWGFGAGRIFDVTALIGTPIHELGHAIMCPIFCHRIDRIRLLSLGSRDGTYGYVEHSYNRRNPWARLGNLFIGIGPIFGGLGVVILLLRLCFSTQWSEYLTLSGQLIAKNASISEFFEGVVSLLLAILRSFSESWLVSSLGFLAILSISLHISLSGADIRGSLSAFPLYLLLAAIFALLTKLFGVSSAILSALELFHFRLLSLFCVVIVFSLAWLVPAFVCWLIRKIF